MSFVWRRERPLEDEERDLLETPLMTPRLAASLGTLGALSDPIQVDEMAREFERLRSEREAEPSGVAAWSAFVALARRPVEAGDAAAGISEDLLTFEVATWDSGAPSVRLVRTVGLQDADTDYVGSRILQCELLYDAADATAEIRDGVINAWLYPELDRPDLEAFVEQVRPTGAFSVLVEGCEPTEISAGLE
jgi:hypothetical protein